MGLQGETIDPIDEVNYSQDDLIDSTNIFSGTKKVVLSKSFKGGDIVNVFGGCEIDLTQADMTTPAELEVTAIFGGATLIVPSNWAIKSEAVTIFGGIGDKRRITPSPDSAYQDTYFKRHYDIWGDGNKKLLRTVTSYKLLDTGEIRSSSIVVTMQLTTETDNSHQNY